jgi:hypothetical protein
LTNAKKPLPVDRIIVEALIHFDRDAPSTDEEVAKLRAESNKRYSSSEGTVCGADPSVSQANTNLPPERIGKAKILDNNYNRKVIGREEALQIELARTLDSSDQTSPSRLTISPHRNDATRPGTGYSGSFHDGIPETLQQLPKGLKRSDPDVSRILNQSHERQKGVKGVMNRTLSVVGLGPKDKRLAEFIHERDIRFLVDNGSSMQEYWDDSITLLEVLFAKVQNLDKDGVDLGFTRSFPEPIKGIKQWPNIERAMEGADPRKVTEEMPTDMCHHLGEIFHDYLVSVKQKKTPKRMTLIIITDGKWAGSEEDTNVEKKIVDFMKLLPERVEGAKMVDRWFTIQFISIGLDPRGYAKMQALDDNLKKRYEIPDVVDHEPVESKNFDKMLIGSISTTEDNTMSELTSPKSEAFSEGTASFSRSRSTSQISNQNRHPP